MSSSVEKTFSAHLICPITLELPFDPVHAEDGKLYERQAIQEYIARQRRRSLKSPMTRAPMGKRLFPAPHIKNLIEEMIENGEVEVDLSLRWINKKKEELFRERLVNAAKGGDSSAMVYLGNCYGEPRHGFPENQKKAFEWVEKAHNAGHVLGTFLFGCSLLEGVGARANAEQGLLHTFDAAQRGCNVAAFFVGAAYMEGKFGLPLDPHQAKKWLRKGLFSCSASEKTKGMYDLKLSEQVDERMDWEQVLDALHKLGTDGVGETS
ncbi:Sel1 domain protein repeat-containing protein [Seminavis robusta]|uniref:Sel1 domain protein repeat-containing protein n=1 Tax=Seminavis robusta TaxID=568900 RepID=A0A9N8EHV5_9STRA|nr:Sel1 domain protein repeat-containing protein [Seminavis robusta]|eukprot:Sro1215_g253210.1 Sel1 domain protein repeat-containing protein (265) ;mRNA; f:22406-23200